jgi:hypothetical protein
MVEEEERWWKKKKGGGRRRKVGVGGRKVMGVRVSE